MLPSPESVATSSVAMPHPSNPNDQTSDSRSRNDTRPAEVASRSRSARLVRGFASGVLRHFQSGLTQGYLVVMLIGTILVAGFLVVR